MPGRLNGKVAVITGGASGIGKACALRFAEEGADIVVADLNPESGAGTVAAVKALGRRATFVKTDTSSAADCEALASEAASAMGRIDLLVAAAGISHALYVSGAASESVGGSRNAAHLINKPIEYWEKVLAVNLTGVMLTNRAVARLMVDTGWQGSIVNIASKVALTGQGLPATCCVRAEGA